MRLLLSEAAAAGILALAGAGGALLLGAWCAGRAWEWVARRAR